MIIPKQTTVSAGLMLALIALAGCGTDPSPTEPSQSPALSKGLSPSLAAVVRELAVAEGLVRLERPAPVREELVELGRALVFDKILSGNRDISCMSCHLPSLGTGDGRSLSIGQGATGLGASRVHPQGAFIPRNAPPLFNLGALKSLFWDGRVSTDSMGRIVTPAGDQLTPAMTQVFEFGPVSALGLFPVMSRAEMRADDGNELAAIPDSDNQGIWRALMARLGGIPRYRRMFEAAYPGTQFDRMTFAHASNAMGGFLIDRFSFTDSPWDRFLRGNDRALNGEELAGAQAFIATRCSACHSGAAFTDNRFFNVAVVQFGPGQGDGPSGHDDFGRMRVTGLATDQYRFRTTPLRNVTLTGPYGHNGAFASLREFIDHYSESELKLRNFDRLTLEPLLQNTVIPTTDAIMATRAGLLRSMVFSPEITDQLTTFMGALTDPRVRNLGRVAPNRVPSGLPIDH